MPALSFMMAILACGEGDAPCREVTQAPVRYESQAECMAATEAELMRRDDMEFPALVAQCRPSNAAPQLLRGSEVMLPDPPLPARPARFAERRQ